MSAKKTCDACTCTEACLRVDFCLVGGGALPERAVAAFPPLEEANPEKHPPPTAKKGGKVIPLPDRFTKLDLEPDAIMEANKGRFEGVVLIGWNKEGGEFCFASTYADGGTVLWLLESARRVLLNNGGA